jgi:hypothetical protein
MRSATRRSSRKLIQLYCYFLPCYPFSRFCTSNNVDDGTTAPPPPERKDNAVVVVQQVGVAVVTPNAKQQQLPRGRHDTTSAVNDPAAAAGLAEPGLSPALVPHDLSRPPAGGKHSLLFCRLLPVHFSFMTVSPSLMPSGLVVLLLYPSINYFFQRTPLVPWADPPPVQKRNERRARDPWDVPRDNTVLPPKTTRRRRRHLNKNSPRRRKRRRRNLLGEKRGHRDAPDAATMAAARAMLL